MYSIQPLHNNSRLKNSDTNSKYRLWELPDMQGNANTEKAIKVRDMTDKSRVLQGKLKQHGGRFNQKGNGHCR